MSRKMVEPNEKDKTTIVTSKILLDRVSHHVLTIGESQTDFITRAIINQLENDGDLEIRDIMEELNND